MKKIYIVLTYTGTMLSKIIKTYTKAEFSHVSISLDLNLSRMYSFGRLNAYNPFFGGFVHECIDKGTFKRFKNTISLIYSLDVTDEQYEIIENIIIKMNSESRKYKYNILGLIAAALYIKLKFRDSFYCTEFVKYLMERAKIDNNLPEIAKPEDFKNIDKLNVVYKGLIREYSYGKVNLVNKLINLNQKA